MAKAAETISTPGPDRDGADPGLTLDDLIAFGRDYLEALEATWKHRFTIGCAISPMRSGPSCTR